MPGISVTSPADYLGIVALLFGIFLILAGLNIFQIQQITVSPGVRTCLVGIIFLTLGIVLLLPEIGLPLGPTPAARVATSTPTDAPSPPTDTPVPEPPMDTPTATPTLAPTETPVLPTSAPVLPTPTPAMPADTPAPATEIPTPTLAPTPPFLGEFSKYGEPSQMNFQKFVGGYMISYEGTTYALCSDDHTNSRGRWVSDRIEWEEGDPVYPEVDGCPIITEGELGPRYGYGKFWCELGLSMRTCLEAPVDRGGEDQEAKVGIYSNGLSFEITDYHSVFELTYDGQKNGTWHRLE